jgi:hypothetical protein
MASWYAMANRDVTTTDERIRIYEKTEKAAKSLSEMKGHIAGYLSNGKSHTAQAVTNKLNALAQAALTVINSHSIQESRLLANWICRHSQYKNGSISEIEGGAYPPFHHLVQILMTSTGQDPNALEMRAVAFIDHAAKENASHQANLPLDVSNTVEQFDASMSLEELKQLRRTSKDNKDNADFSLIRRLNSGKTKFSELRLFSADQVAAFFKTKCSEILLLSVSQFPTELRRGGSKVVISAEQLSKDFPNLFSLELQLDEGSDSVEIQDLALANLQTLAVSTTELVDRIYKFECHLTEKIPNLNRLNLDRIHYLALTTSEGRTLGSDFQINSPSVESLELQGLTIENERLCSNLPALENIVAQDCSGVSKINFSQFPRLKTVALNSCKEEELNLNHCPKIQSLNVSGIENIHISHCPNLVSILLQTPKTVTIESCPNIVSFHCKGADLLQDFSFLNIKNFPLLESLSVESVEDLSSTEIPFGMLKRLSVSLRTKDFSFLKNCTNLERLEIDGDSIQNSQLDMDFVNLIPPTLQQLSISKQIPLSDEVVLALKNKVSWLLRF